MERYVACDLEASHDIALDITRLPFPDSTFDLVICCHVLEHIPDDVTAMRELCRITAPGGVVLIQVPWIPGSMTDEDPGASPADRTRRFGQRDHVRMYGRDVVDRMEAAGLSTSVVDAIELADYEQIGSPTNQAVFVGRPRS
jgi:SAM-dependent methyltransferase